MNTATPQLGELGPYRVDQTENSIKFSLTGSSIAWVILYRYVLFSLGHFLVMQLYQLKHDQSFVILIGLLVMAPVAYLILAPIRLGFEISGGRVTISRFMLVYLQRREIPLSEISHFSYSTFRGSKSIATAINLFFHTTGKKYQAARMIAWSESGANELGDKAKSAVTRYLK